MSRYSPEEVVSALRARPLVAVVRLPEVSAALPLARALAAGGVGAIEFTLTSAGALEAIEAVAASGEMLVGAGSVLSADDARATIRAGAHFVVSPVTDLDTLRLCREEGVACMPGALTPTEILAAWRAGATVVKIFPAGAVGPGYLRDVLAPMPELGLMPTGGVGPDNAAAYLRAGAVAVGAGSSLVEPALVAAGDWAALTERARRFVAALGQA